MFDCGSLKAIVLTAQHPDGDGRKDTKIFRLHDMETPTPGNAKAEVTLGVETISINFIFGFKEQVSCAGCGTLIVPLDDAQLCDKCSTRLNSKPLPTDYGGEKQ